MTERSPYPWISTKVWDVWERIYSRDGSIARRSLQDAVVVSVSADDRRRSAILDVAGPSEQAPSKSISDLRQRLSHTRVPGRVVGVRWPACCDILCTLVFHHGAGEDFDELESRAGRLDEILLESHTEDEGRSVRELLNEWAKLLDQVRKRRHSGESIDIFHCANCGRLYGSYSEP